MRVEQDNLTRLYQPILLEKALTIIHQPYPQFTEDGPALQEDPLLSSQQAFQAFVNKLAQACDSRPGGDTVTAVTILRDADNFPWYVVACNFRSKEALQGTKAFLDSLLRMIRDEQDMGRRPLLKQILWQLLSFSFPRVKLYLNNLLSHLRERAMFPRDITNRNAKAKFLSDCETCINVIHGARGKEVDEAIRSQSRDNEMEIAQVWHELRHYLGRLLSYRQAAEILLGAFDRWPSLFRDFTIDTIPSNGRASRPLPKSKLTAEEIIVNMSENASEAKTYLQQAYDLQNMALDERIQQQVEKSFRPVLHAEVALHEHLLRVGIEHPERYWNNNKYIGSSKPTFAVRAGHDNLYANWQFPPAPEQEGRMGLQANLELLGIITVLVRNDAKRTLDERRPRGKRHDSNTASSMPAYFDLGSHGTSSQTSNSRRPDRDKGLQRKDGSGAYKGDDWDSYELIASGGDDEPGNDGASISGERY
ncbi:hypothetical protein PFICI_13422 [Pestalotiopsis fici W106-1]|uniref:Uncharacterized protein n=1 Tax=Pestalotiopsis fici (strain W106-1 / CGMCC3.15140) TaxID=1229662 RepID=W3WM40_PESFW|nr:uncharacterized protein PFICI_13422 [Pestalotiopsis fici W106-1]ETS74938.1 hypothetical protein PFICI_13422 [Pestalotiopsis fici W106-1]